MEKIFWRVLHSAADKALDKDARNTQRYLRRRAMEESAEFVFRHMLLVQSARDRYDLLSRAIASVEVAGSFAEFGVHKARSLNFIAARTDRPVYGFDSFKGLPEDYMDGYPKGMFKVATLPKVRKNVTLVKGWYEDTLGPFLEDHDEQLAFLHIDCDLYSSTKAVFYHLGKRLVAGTVIVFDEFFNYPNWKNDGEYKAFMEFVENNNVEFEYIGYTRNGPCVAVRLTKV